MVEMYGRVTQSHPPASVPDSPRAESATPIRVVSWTLRDLRRVTAVHAPERDGDPTPWLAYEGDRFVGRVDNSQIPPSATTVFAGAGPMSDIKDGVFYEVIVDDMKGTGVRNSPLTKSTPDRPWVVTLHGRSGGQLMADNLPDGSVRIIRPVADGAP